MFGFRAGVRHVPELRLGPLATCAISVAPPHRACSYRTAPPATTPSGQDLRLAIGALGTFAHHTVSTRPAASRSTRRCRSIAPACWAAASSPVGARRSTPHRSQPGDTVAVVGCGGIGSNAIQGAKLGRGASDRGDRPGRVQAGEGDGVRRDAHLRLDRRGDGAICRPAPGDRGFDKVIMTMGVGNGDALGQAFWLGGKRSKIVVTNIHPMTETSIAIPAIFLTVLREAADRLAVRFGQPSQGHPQAAGAVHPGSARPRRSGHAHVSARGDQRRLRRHERRQEHPRRVGLRMSRRVTDGRRRSAGRAGARPRRRSRARGRAGGRRAGRRSSRVARGSAGHRQEHAAARRRRRARLSASSSSRATPS